jgi:Pentapeptide repeats (8 copies)
MWSSCFFYRVEFCGVILPVRLMLPIFFNIDEFCGVVLRVAMILLNFVNNDDFSGVDFSGVDFSGVDISGVDFSGVDLHVAVMFLNFVNNDDFCVRTSPFSFLVSEFVSFVLIIFLLYSMNFWSKKSISPICSFPVLLSDTPKIFGNTQIFIYINYIVSG